MQPWPPTDTASGVVFDLNPGDTAPLVPAQRDLDGLRAVTTDRSPATVSLLAVAARRATARHAYHNEPRCGPCLNGNPLHCERPSVRLLPYKPKAGSPTPDGWTTAGRAGRQRQTSPR